MFKFTLTLLLCCISLAIKAQFTYMDPAKDSTGKKLTLEMDEFPIRSLGFVALMTYYKGKVEKLGMQQFEVSDSIEALRNTSKIFLDQYLTIKVNVDILCNQIIADMYQCNSINPYRTINKMVKNKSYKGFDKTTSYGAHIYTIKKSVEKLEEYIVGPHTEFYALFPIGGGDLPDYLSIGVDIYKEIQAAKTTKVDRIVSVINNLRIISLKDFKSTSDDKKK